MSHGTGQGELEVRVLTLERKAFSPEIPNIENRLAAVEQNQYQPQGGGGQGPGSAFTLAVTGGSAIAAGTATVPTSGTVTLRLFDGTTLSADTATVTAFNYHDKIIAAGSLVALAYGLGAWWIVDVRSCTNLS